MNYPGRLIAGFMMIMLIVVFPLQYLAQTNSDTIDVLVDEKTQAFADSIRKKGQLDIATYEDFIHFLDATGELYDVEIEDIHPVTGEELFNVGTERDITACTDNTHDHHVEKSINLSGRRVESPTAVSMKYTEAIDSTKVRNMSYTGDGKGPIRSLANHSHSEDCYNGTLHICDGISCTMRKIAVGLTSNGLYYTFDGLTWTKAAIYVEYADIRGVTYGNDKFVAYGRNGIWISSNGIEWTIPTVNYNLSSNYRVDVISAAYGNGIFLACVAATDYYGNGTKYKILKSTDAINWADASSFSSEDFSRIYYTDKVFYVKTSERVCKYTFDANGNLVRGNWTEDRGTYFQAGEVVFSRHAGTGYSGTIIKGNNGHVINNPKLVAIASVNGIYLGVCTDIYQKGTYTASEYNSSWTKISDFSLNSFSKIIYFGDCYLAAGGYYSSNFDTAAISTDGITWTTAAFNDLRDIACNADNGSGIIKECLKIGKYYDANGNEVQPICDQVVASITPTHPTQTIEPGDSIINTAIAIFLNGSTGIVNCSGNYNPNMEGDQTVALTYTGLVGNAKTVGTRTCTVNVKVINKVPLSHIEVIPLEQNVERYKTPGFHVVAYYADGSYKLIETYTMTGFDASKIGAQTVAITYSEGGITKTAEAVVNVAPLHKVCKRCGTYYPLDENDTDMGCPICNRSITRIEVDPEFLVVEQGTSLNITVKAVYKDGHTEVVIGWTSNFDPFMLGRQTVIVEYGGYAAELAVWVEEMSSICPICGGKYPSSEGKCSVCSEKIVSITVDPESITVKQYDPIFLTVTANYADGSSSLVDDWSIDRTSAEPGTYIMTVSYRSVTAAVTLSVIPLSAVECPFCGLVYNPFDHPYGCPVCSEEIVGIEAYLSSGSNLVQYGSIPSIEIVLVFRDEHKEIDTEGYSIEDYYPYQLGAQTITVRYNKFYVDMEVIVVDALAGITCPNGHVYYLNEDGSDPGCPYCAAAENHGAIYFFDIVYANEIIEIIYAEGIYMFEQGNYVTVTVTKRTVSLFYHMQNTFLRTSMLGMKRKYIHGGGIY